MVATKQATFPTKLEQELVDRAKQLVRYYEEPAWAIEQEREASEITGGNVSALEGIASNLRTALSRLLEN